MKHKHFGGAARTAFALAVIASASHGQTSYASQDIPRDTPAADWTPADLDLPISNQLGLPAWLRMGGQYRGRFENDSSLAFAPGANDTYYLQRIRGFVDLQPTSWLRFVGVFQDGRNLLYGARAQPMYSSDPVDLHEAYVELGKREGTGFDVKIGRQEVSLGSQRLVGSGDWLNSGRSHDVVRAGYTNVEAGVHVDAIAGSLVLVNPNAFDEHTPGEHWYSIYATFKKFLPKAQVEPYYFLKTTWNTKSELGRIGDTYVNTLGGRILGELPGRFDYSLEMARQIGHYSTDPIRAGAGAYILGWRVARAEWKPRVSAEYDFATGDKNPKDSVRGTFDNMYCGHGYYGFADQLGWRNLRSARAGFDFQASRKIQIRFDALNDFLYTTEDWMYNVGGSPKILDRNAPSSHIGEEADALVIFQLSKNTQIKAGFNHIFPGRYLKEATKGGSYSSPFVMWTKNF